ncbi:MAG: ABC transporter substrate-binding protein, partial [Chthoniobacteraceae bacterium]
MWRESSARLANGENSTPRSSFVSGKKTMKVKQSFQPTPNLSVLICACIGALFAMFTAGCGDARQSELRIAINPWPGSEFLYLAKEKGFLAAERLNVRLVEYSSLSDCRVAFESGQVDAMTGTLIDVLMARENSQRISQIVLVSDYSDGADVILARPDITSVPALKGRRVGLE